MIWRDEETETTFTDEKQYCSICGKESAIVIEMLDQGKTISKKACTDGRKNCLNKMMRQMLDEFPNNEYTWMRMIFFQPASKKSQKIRKKTNSKNKDKRGN